MSLAKMLLTSSFLILLVYFQSSSSYSFLEPDDDLSIKEFIWPTEYHISGEEISLHTGIKENFEIWYSAALNRSRIDYYGGIEKKYYYGETDNVSATIYVIHHIVANNEDKLECKLLPNEDSSAKNFLPEMKNFTYTGEKIYSNRKVQVWERVQELKGSIKTHSTMYAFVKDGVHVPVKLVVKKYNFKKGILEEHTIVNFHQYESEVESGWLDVEFEGAVCEIPEVFGKNLNDDLKYLRPGILEDSDFAFKRYKIHHEKKYEEEEYELRKMIFHSNWKFIDDHNKKNLGYRLEINAFADKTKDELKFLTGTRPSNLGSNAADSNDSELLKGIEGLPEELDLRLEGVITPIKNQANCGSCWAFSSTAAVEGVLARNNGGRDLDLSEQSLVDCAWEFNNNGCEGGVIEGAMKYILAHGIPMEKDYGPYLTKEGICEIQNMTNVYTIKGFGHVTPHNIEAMKAALYKYGPVVVGVYASDKMTFYSSGIFYDIGCEQESINHGVTVVGYGVKNGEMYWIAKNSWGESWGEGGFILISATNNNCQLLDVAYYPIA